MVKARIGKTEIEGTVEEVAYILHGILRTQEGIETMPPQLPPRVPIYRVPALSRSKKPFGVNRIGIIGKRGKNTSYRKMLGCTLLDWIKKNYQTFQNSEKGSR